MRGMGNAYLKNEFELHKTAKPEHLEKFYSGWEEYLHTLRQQGQRRCRSGVEFVRLGVA